MASPFTGPTAVADVIKDLDTQIAVSKAPGACHGAGMWDLSRESAHPISFAFGDLNGTQRGAIRSVNKRTKRLYANKALSAQGFRSFLPCMVDKNSCFLDL